MRTLHDSLRKYVSELISLKMESVVSVSEVYDALVEPPNPELGDLAFGCFPLAKALKKGPPQISAELKAKISADDVISKVEAVGPYLNISFTAKALGEKLLAPIQAGVHFRIPLTEKTPKSMVEYSQPNTHKELHVGHMRNLCLGDALIRIQKYAGYEIVSSTFPGDVGTHVAKCLWYMKFHNQESVPTSGKGEWLGRMYSMGNNKLEDETGTPQEEKNRETLTMILHQLEAKSGEYFELWKETRQWSIDLMKSVYEWAGVIFDSWYWESDVDSASVKYVKGLYESGKLIESQGAIGMNLEADGLGFCLLLKKDGTGLYATKDIELARRKFNDFKIEKSIYVVDMRQALHFKQVFKVLEHLGFSQAKDCFHLQYNFVELPDGAMSSRKGNIVPLMTLVKGMEAMVKEQYLERYKAEWKQDEIDLVASQVAKGAIKYGMLRIDNNKKIVFDMNEWLKLDGESGPFIQYSFARINSLCRKMGFESSKGVDFSLLTHSAERKLMQGLIHFNTVAVRAAEEYRPSLLCTYLYEVAKKFNYFYHECSIGQAETAELKEARLALSYCTGQILKEGLALLGIPVPERM
jgi:arginyl-tRNA synthetase